MLTVKLFYDKLASVLVSVHGVSSGQHRIFLFFDPVFILAPPLRCIKQDGILLLLMTYHSPGRYHVLFALWKWESQGRTMERFVRPDSPRSPSSSRSYCKPRVFYQSLEIKTPQDKLVLVQILQNMDVRA